MATIFSRSSKSLLKGDELVAGTRANASPSGKIEYGLHTLVPKAPVATEVVDVVAIHGLNGHYEKTWTDEATGFNWLRDALPDEEWLPMARIMTFAYNSAVQFSKSTSDLFTFADQLLENLVQERRTEAEQDRPLVFICHSLGGIVFKQAVVRAYENSRYVHLARRITGVCFFGTPHRGSAMASVASTLGRLLKLAALGSSTNTQLSRDLEPDSRILDLISRSFVDRASSMRILTFYETEKMDFASAVVVDRDSAVTGLANETAVPLDRNHRTMCRFASAKDKLLQVILNNVSGIARRAAHRTDSLHVDQFLRRLATSSPETHKARNPAAVPGTCRWILTHSTYQNWLCSPESSLLWFSADPGCGKSVLASFLVDHHTANQARSTQFNVCYFFFRSDSREQLDAVHALQGLLRQLYLSQRSLLPIGFERLGEKKGADVEDLWNAFVMSTEKRDKGDGIKARDTICILDGLDECESASRRSLTRLISTYFSSCSDGTAYKAEGTPRLKLFVSSRPDNSIKVAFDRPKSPLRAKGGEASNASTPRCSMIRLRGEDETDAVSNDICLVVKASISGLVDQGLPPELLEDVQDEVIVRADRTFLWATLILQLLEERVEAGASRRELDEILRSRDIDAVYAGLLGGRPDAPRARKLLSLVLAAERALSVEELSIALATTPEHSTFQESEHLRRPGRYTYKDIEYDLVFPFENHIKALCGHFVRIIRNRVYLVHETAREFLLDQAGPVEDDTPFWWDEDADLETLSPSVADAPPKIQLTRPSGLSWQYSFSITDCHALLLEICVTYLYCLGKRRKNTTLGVPTLRTAAFLPYAAKFWPTHFAEIRHKLLSADLPYYQNLCHPRFPGFEVWTAEHDVDPATFPGADDDTHDYYVRALRIDLEDTVRSDALPLGTIQSFLSSNPSTASVHHFPVQANDDGFVSLDHSRAHHMFHPNGVQFKTGT